jgi:ribosomal protein L11 methylase PrmA
MNTAEPRWRVTIEIDDEQAWEQQLAGASDMGLEGVVELAAGAELYFTTHEQARLAAERFGWPKPELGGAGGGEVFGQTSHPTTELCLQLLPEVVMAGCVAADIGSGTGRLAAAAIELGARLAIAADIDWPAAVASKQTTEVVIQGSADALVTGRFDVILANLHLSLWRGLAPEITRIAAPEARLVASGFLATQEPDAAAMLEAGGWCIVDKSYGDGWMALYAHRADRAGAALG